MGVPVYGCGYVQDSMPVRGVGKAPVTMQLTKDVYGNSYVAAVLGQSTYNEPIMLTDQIKSLRKAIDVMPWLKSEMDLGTREILSRAVLSI